MKYALILIVVSAGCSAAPPNASAWQQAMQQGDSDLLASTKNVEATTSEAIEILRDNTTALAAIKSQIDALQVVSKPQQLGGDPKASPPESPAKADTQTPVKAATPGTSSRITSDGTRLRWNIEGNWNPTILETSAHLREHGIETHGMTHQEMADIHAAIHEGKPVAMRSKTVAYSSFVNRGTNCPNGQCPTSSTRYVRRSRR